MGIALLLSGFNQGFFVWDRHLELNDTTVIAAVTLKL